MFKTKNKNTKVSKIQWYWKQNVNNIALIVPQKTLPYQDPTQNIYMLMWAILFPLQTSLVPSITVNLSSWMFGVV